uniref:Uncharacterized protein n=1 Tax=Oryza brachyantha TaxID=4533 RepID=J3ME78_ORYBR
MSGQDHATSSTTAGTSSRSRQSQNKLPDSKFTITKVDRTGTPIATEAAARRFSNDEARLKKRAFSTIGTAWKNFKHELHTEYMLDPNESIPLEDYPHITPEICEQFKRLKRTPEFQAISEAHRQLQARNEHPHMLRTGGYIRRMEQWRKEDEVARQSNILAPFADIPDERARNWDRAQGEETAMCILQVRMAPSFVCDAAKGQAYKPTTTTRVHDANLVAGHAKAYFVVGFDDIYDLFRLRAVDTGYVWKETRRTNNQVGFIDPYKINGTQLNNALEDVLEYIRNILWAHQDKEFIMFPQNQQ